MDSARSDNPPLDVRRLASASPATRGAGLHPPRLSNPAANERMTALAALPLLVLLAVEGITLLFLRDLLPVHILVGLALVPPVLLKLATTGWRFFRYYSGDREYVRRGAPSLPLRVLAPVLVLSTAAVLASGIAFVLVPSHPGALLMLHKASFVVWGPVFAIHVLAYVWRLPGLVLRTAGAQRLALAGALALAAVFALTTLDVGHLPLQWADFDDGFAG
jgi:hypothetical protein